MSANVNYIKHQHGFFRLAYDDDKLSAYHISLYLALFQSWNLNRFKNPISIARSEIMSISKIGSVNTYSKCMKELAEWKYIDYFPSHNPHLGSKVKMIRFDTSNDSCFDITVDKTSDNVERPLINTFKNQKQQINSVGDTEDKISDHLKHLLLCSLDEVKDFFLEQASSIDEAEKFYNYYDSKGWLVGIGTKMQKWKPAARNWILRCKETPPKRNMAKKEIQNETNFKQPL